MRVDVLGSGPEAAPAAARLRDFGVEAELVESGAGHPDAAARLSPGFDAEHETRLALESIERGIPFISASWDPAVLRALTEVTNEARLNNVLVVAGASFTPGLLGTLAAVGVEELGGAGEAEFGWIVSTRGPWGGVAKKFLAQSGGPSGLSFSEGEFGGRSTAGVRRRIYFPEPVGWRTVDRRSGPEAQLLTETFAGLDSVKVWGGFVEAVPSLFSGRVNTVVDLINRFSSAAGWCALRVEVRARSGEQAILGVVDQMGTLRWAPAALAAVKAAKGEDHPSGGVRPLWKAFPPRLMLEELAEIGVRTARLHPSLESV